MFSVEPSTNLVNFNTRRDAQYYVVVCCTNLWWIKVHEHLPNIPEHLEVVSQKSLQQTKLIVATFELFLYIHIPLYVYIHTCKTKRSLKHLNLDQS